MTRPRASAKVGAHWTRGEIRRAAHDFLGHYPRSGVTKMGPVWHAIGPTAREAMITHAVWKDVLQVDRAGAGSVPFTIDDLRAVRAAFLEECEALGFGVFS